MLLILTVTGSAAHGGNSGPKEHSGEGQDSIDPSPLRIFDPLNIARGNEKYEEAAWAPNDVKISVVMDRQKSEGPHRTSHTPETSPK